VAERFWAIFLDRARERSTTAASLLCGVHMIYPSLLHCAIRQTVRLPDVLLPVDLVRVAVNDEAFGLLNDRKRGFKSQLQIIHRAAPFLALASRAARS
jgi:hypothetical protein